MADQFVVIHPLDDAPEQKVDIASLGPMPMTRSVRFSLYSLRGYLVLMMLLVLYHVLHLAGLFGVGAQTTVLRKTPMPSISTSTVSPGDSLRVLPGVPV